MCLSSSRPAGAWGRLSSDRSGTHTGRGHRNLELCKTLKTTTEQFSLFSTEQFGGRRIKSGTRGKPLTPGAGHRHTGVGAVSRCPRVQNASMCHILHAVSEEPARISRSCLAGSEGSCGPATTLQAVSPRSARLMATCELKTRPARLLSYAGCFLPCCSAACQPPETTASHRYQR